MRKNLLYALPAFAVLLPLVASAALSGPFAQIGNHNGEARYLVYHIEYLSPLGITRVDEDGITFIPDAGLSHTDATVLPERYFGDYPLYFAGGTMRFRVVIENTSRRTYKNLQVFAWQEYLNPEGDAGEAIGSDNATDWYLEELRGGEEVILEGEFTIPLDVFSGIDQTHLQILHWEGQGKDLPHVGGGPPSGRGSPAGGRVIIDDAQAGIWCPTS